jgi:hypothetical protein
MASLTQISIISRRSIRFAIYAVIFIVIARYALNAGKGIYAILNPPKPPGPNLCFGPLPGLTFPEKSVPDKVNYTLETVQGGLPNFPKIAKVYSMPPFSPSLSAIDEARERAKKLGFNPAGRIIVENVPNIYVFNKNNEPSTLTMNINNGIFSISYDTTLASNLLTSMPPDVPTATSQVRSYLSSAGLLPADISGPVKHQFMKLEGGQFLPAISQSEANLIRIDLFRQSVDEIYPAVTSKGKNANIWFMISGSTRGDRSVIAAEYHYFPVDQTAYCTYPVIPAETAWEKLKKGEAFFANYDSQQNVRIRNVYLGYYDAGQYSEFYQPVVVFEGDDDFVAYVPALGNESYTDNVAQ